MRNLEDLAPTVAALSNRDETQALIDEVRRALPTLLANADITAQMRRAKFLALVKVGFTEAQALDLCWR